MTNEHKMIKYDRLFDEITELAGGMPVTDAFIALQTGQNILHAEMQTLFDEVRRCRIMLKKQQDAPKGFGG